MQLSCTHRTGRVFGCATADPKESKLKNHLCRPHIGLLLDSPGLEVQSNAKGHSLGERGEGGALVGNAEARRFT